MYLDRQVTQIPRAAEGSRPSPSSPSGIRLETQLLHPVLGTTSINSILSGVSAVITLRVILELLLEAPHRLGSGTDLYTSVLAYLHHYISWLCLFWSVALSISTVVGTSLWTSLRLVLLCSPVITIVPVIDSVLDPTGAITYGDTWEDFFFNFTHLFDPTSRISMVTVGVRIEVFVATAGAVFVCRRFCQCTVPRAIAAGMSLYAIVFAFGYLPAAAGGLIDSQGPVSGCALYIPVVGVLTIITGAKLLHEDRRWILALRHIFYPSRLCYYLMLYGLGFLFATTRGNLLDRDFASDAVIRWAFGAFSIVTLFVYSKWRNDVYDLEIDRISNSDRPIPSGLIGQESALNSGMLFLIPSAVSGLNCERYFMVLWLGMLLLSKSYSEPPFRLRRYYPVGHQTLAIIGVLALFSGALIVTSKDFFLIPGIQHLALTVAVAFFALSHIKDLKDIKADAQAGVMNVYDMAARPRTVAVVAIWIFALAAYSGLAIVGANGLWSFALIAASAGFSTASIAASRDLRQLDFLLVQNLAALILSCLPWITRLLSTNA